MSAFLDRIFGSKVEVDLMQQQLEAELSLLGSKHDEHLAKAVFAAAERENIRERYLHYLEGVSAVADVERLPLADEIERLQTYMALYKTALADALHMHIDIKVEVEANIPAFLLFPLLRNAIQWGYNSMEEFPLKLRIRALGTKLNLELSNRVNHRIASQEATAVIQQFKSRLECLYGDSATLFFNSNSHTFKAVLHVELSQGEGRQE